MKIMNPESGKSKGAFQQIWHNKYQAAAYGFFGLNLVYAGLAWEFMPPFMKSFPKEIFWTGFMLLILLLTVFIYKGKKRLVQILAVIYALRSVGAGALLITGKSIPGVPYFLPCLILAFYILGRAGWEWP